MKLCSEDEQNREITEDEKVKISNNFDNNTKQNPNITNAMGNNHN